MTSVSFLADRMHRAFEFDARQLLASDLLIASDQPLSERFLQEAQDRQLQIAQTVVFPSMATVGSHSKLASIKAVSPKYPLRGSLQVESSQQVMSSSLMSGTVYVEPALLNNLHAQLGDSVRLGDRQFVIAGVLMRELDRGAGFMNFAPRVMMSLEDLQSTGLIGLVVASPIVCYWLDQMSRSLSIKNGPAPISKVKTFAVSGLRHSKTLSRSCAKR